MIFPKDAINCLLPRDLEFDPVTVSIRKKKNKKLADIPCGVQLYCRWYFKVSGEKSLIISL